MKPSMTDQLHQTVRALRNGVLPHIHDPEARRIAESSIAGLELLESSWSGVLPFLAWDNAEMTQLLCERGIPLGVAEPTAGEPAHLTVDEHEERNIALRGRLEAHLSSGGRVDLEILDYLDQRARRYPLRYVPRMNTGTTPEEQ